MSETSSVTALIRRIEADPLDVPLYHRLAELYAVGGHFRKAELVLRRAIEIAPLTRDTWIRLGKLLSTLGKWSNAVDAFKQASSLGPATADDTICFAFALLSNQDLAQAEPLSSQLLEAYPQRAESHLIAGHIEKVRGHFDAAVARYKAALAVDARATEAAYHLCDLEPPGCADALTQELEARRNDRTLSPGQRADLLFALARIYERAEQVDATFHTLTEANDVAREAMTRVGQSYDPNEIARQASEIVTTFSAAVCRSPLESIDLDTKLIFIVGLPRSGTTLIERILSSHPRVMSGGELPFMHESLEKYLAARRSAGYQGSVASSNASERGLLLAAREEYLDRLFERDLDADFVIDKLPANFAAVGLIRVLFPDAVILHCRRDPMATSWSLFRSHFGIHASYSTTFTHLAHYYKIYAGLMTHWNEVVKAPLSEVRYEQIVCDPEPVIRRLLDTCGVEWSDSCLRFEENDSPVYTASLQEVRQPLYQESVSRWRKFSAPLAPLAALLAPYVQGYAARPEGMPDTDTR
jgi:tetratricopeptide (TPR) repeat protein